MTTILLDTNIVSYLFNNDTRSELYCPHLEGSAQLIAFMTVTELEFGASIARWGAFRRRRLTRFLHGFAVVESTPDICLLWAQVMAAGKHQGRPILHADAWIAACAL